MSLDYTPRVLDKDEFDFLNRLKDEAKRQLNHKPPYLFFLGCLFVAILSWYLITVIEVVFLKKILGCVFVLAFAIITIGSYLCIKGYRQATRKIKALDVFLYNHTVSVISITVSRIAVAKEYEDEGDWYIIECTNRDVFYFWDIGDVPRGFPFDKFEIYEPAFCNLTRRLVNPLGESVKPVSLHKKTKWEYLKRYGGSEGKETGGVGFDEIMDRFDNLKKEMRLSSKQKR